MGGDEMKKKYDDIGIWKEMCLTYVIRAIIMLEKNDETTKTAIEKIIFKVQYLPSSVNFLKRWEENPC